QEYAVASALVPAISLEECNALINKLIAPHNQVITIEGVEKQGLSYPSSDQLLQIANREKDTVMEAYVDNSSSEPILAAIPKPGKIVKEKSFKAAGVKQWTLSNGVRVFSKKTDFKNDEIVFLATSPGGYSKLPVGDMNAAKYLYWYITESGLGDFDAAALDKALAGKIVDVAPTVNLYDETLDGSCSPADLETMFQLIYQNAMAPRWNQTSLEANIFRVKGLLEDRLLNPEMAFYDSLQILANQQNPYNNSTKIKDLDNLTLDQMRRTFENRFADFSDFTFTFVGNFDEARLREYAATYLATLPSSGRNEKPTDVGMRPNTGLKTYTFKKGGDNKSYVGLITTGKAKLDPASDIARNAMLMVLNEKLRENIREERSGVYFVQTMSDIESFPSKSFTLLTIMSCSADRVDELIGAITATMDSISAGQFDQKYIDSAKVTLQKRYEESIRRNNYWMANIVNSLKEGSKPGELLKYPELYAKIDRKSIVKSARQHLLHKDNLIKLIMLPE
ncbi:MAG TPA: insulinase family protein, partial [Candidatus Cloacimonadota bacterium]|nr:insulinase family protein [Candidatus Cloacimonadota bacterium]